VNIAPGLLANASAVTLALLAYLSLAHPHGLHPRDTVIALLWPESDQAQGRHALRNAMHAIRTALGSQVFLTEGDGLVGINQAIMSCDAIDVEAGVTAGRSDEVLARHEGHLMEGFHVSGAQDFEEWLASERRRLDELVLSASWSLSESLERSGDGERALMIARRECTHAPHDERSLRRLIELLDNRGEAAAALRAYQEFASRPERELGVEPSPAVARIAGGIRARGPAVIHHDQMVPRPAPTKDAATYIQYVRGTYLFLRAAHGGNPQDLQESRALFEAALARDASFALAYAGLSNYLAVAAARNIVRPFDTTFARAIELSRRALEFDPTLAIPHVHFGVKAMYLDGDWKAAGREFMQADALDPSYAEARRFLGIWYDAVGNPQQALFELREAVRLEPQIAIFRNTLAAALMDRGDWAAAMREVERALELDPGYGAARERFIRCAEECGLYDVAIVERTREPMIGAVDLFRRALAEDGASGYRRIAREELRALIPVLEARAAVYPPANAGDLFQPPELRLAVINARLEEWDAASRWEESACRRRPGLRQWFKARPELRRP
jgi:DNA-binding SARP family transcriptional activator/tetratricopeptide (TPR) repeat protein